MALSFMKMIRHLKDIPNGIAVEAEFKPLESAIDVYVYSDDFNYVDRFMLKRLSDDLNIERDAIYKLIDKVFFEQIGFEQDGKLT